MTVIDGGPLSQPPHTCIVTGRDDGPVVDLGVETNGWDQHIYLRTSVIEEAGRLIGMVEKAQVDELTEQVAAYGARVDQMTTELEALRAYRDASERLDTLTETPTPIGA